MKIKGIVLHPIIIRLDFDEIIDFRNVSANFPEKKKVELNLKSDFSCDWL